MARNLLTPEQTERLKQTLASGSRLGASDLRLLNMDVYRERLGADWFKYKGIINALAAAAIKAELAREDFYVETKNGYGIFFFKKDLDEIQVISDRIADKLQRELSRESVFGDPPLTCVAKSANCDDFLRQLEADERSARAAAQPAPQAAQMIAAEPSVYAPLWHTKVQRVLGSMFVPQPPAVTRRVTDREYYSSNEAHAVRDIRGFTTMLADAYKLQKAGQSTTIVFSINFSTFCSIEFNKDYMLALRQTPAPLLQYLTPRFVRIPPGTVQPLLAAKVQLLASIFRHVVVHSRALVALQTLEFVSCSILSTSWKDVQTVISDRAGKCSAVDVLRLFQNSAKTLRLNSLIGGIDTPEALNAALVADIELVSGSAVMPFAEAPFAQRAFTLKDVRAGQNQLARAELLARR
jgi:hypothetical protein